MRTACIYHSSDVSSGARFKPCRTLTPDPEISPRNAGPGLMDDPEGTSQLRFRGRPRCRRPSVAAAAVAGPLAPSDPTAAAASAGASSPLARPIGWPSQAERFREAELPADGVPPLAPWPLYEGRCLRLPPPVRQGPDAGVPLLPALRRVPRAGLCLQAHQRGHQGVQHDQTSHEMEIGYKFGFCPNGPDCRYRHAKLPGPPPPVEEVLQKIQHLTSAYGSSNRFYHHRNNNNSYNQQPDKNQLSSAPGFPNQNTGVKPVSSFEPSDVKLPQSLVQQSEQQQQQLPIPSLENQVPSISNALSNQTVRTASPLLRDNLGQDQVVYNLKRYFIVKSCNRENLEISVQQGMWATQRSNEAKLNEAFESTENVILIFSINKTRHFQGCAKMTSRIGGFAGGGNWKYSHGTAHYGLNFSVKWLKLCELSFNKTHHLRNPYNDNLPVKISRDCQELEPFIGEQLASLLYLEPESELMAMLVAAESKRDEEKAKGGGADEATDNPDIVLFEDNEEEESEEEESEEDDESSQAAHGRGRGRGMMWQPHMPLVRGGRPMLGVRGFPPPMMMGADGFGYGDGFSTPDLFGPRIFPPFGGPRFSGDFSAGLVFPGRPPQPGAVFPMGNLGMMMGPGRAPFMGGMPMAGMGRANRPVGVPPFLHPPPLNSRAAKRDHRRPVSDRNDRYETGSDQGNRSQEMAGAVGGADDGGAYWQGERASDHKYGPGKSFQNNESESKDEMAPRRSRHSDGK
ncbi:zinc finger CCCH domain-containing protein [Musa troglodytarum]|uniref:YTH domain-containing family protein n=1 Tax=Musa troglodytarum TaxID=320322 RepID=A0A9E7HLP6_9LILI|nr:zinc finger CCCH domain-containing protein [Musa troglodytarum]